jgi:hypothetical protein
VTYSPGRPDRRRRSIEDVIRARRDRRRARIRSDIARSRKGDHLVPTWVLAAVLSVLVLGWLYLIFGT